MDVETGGGGMFVVASSLGSRAVGVTTAAVVQSELERGARGSGRSQRSRLAIAL